jgi:hypothetical protein
MDHEQKTMASLDVLVKPPHRPVEPHSSNVDCNDADSHRTDHKAFEAAKVQPLADSDNGHDNVQVDWNEDVAFDCPGNTGSAEGKDGEDFGQHHETDSLT